jgi:hypothetical protein
VESWGISGAAAQGISNTCHSWPTNSSALFNVLGERVVNAASRAALPVVGDEKGLDAYVAKDADFDLGAGDVGRPLGQGSSGFRRLMRELQADRYRFDGWDYMSKQEDPCDTHEVTVEFSSRKIGHRAEVKFEFRAGVIVKGKRWLRSTTTGDFPITPVDR